MSKLEILSKYDDIPKTGDLFENNRLGAARIACGILKKMAVMNSTFHFNFALSIAYLCRKAMLTTEERAIVFGEGVIERGIFQLGERDQDAIALSMLEKIDYEDFFAAVNLAHDIMNWEELTCLKLDEFLHTKTPDAAILCLLANRCGGVQYIDDDIEEMEAVVHNIHPQIDKFFDLL